MENKRYEIPGLERESFTMKLFRSLSIWSVPEDKEEEIRPDVLTHALQSLDSGVMLGITDPEERDAIIYSIVAPKLDNIEEHLHLHGNMNKRRFL